MWAICACIRQGDGMWDDLVRFFHAFGLKLAAWVSILMVAVHLHRARNERLRDLQTEKGGDWDRLRGEIDRLDERCDHLQTEVDECREREGEWMKRAIAAEAYQLGEGEALQKAQRIVSTERQKKPGNGDDA